jgi:hypothetical protein
MSDATLCEGDYAVFRLSKKQYQTGKPTNSEEDLVHDSHDLYVGYIHEASPPSYRCEVIFILIELERAQILDFLDPLRSSHKCRVRFLSPGRPMENEVDGMDPHMCVPVEPTKDRLEGRQQLITVPILPWVDQECFHHSNMSVLLRIRTPANPDFANAEERIPDQDRDTDSTVQLVQGARTTISFEQMFDHDFLIQEDEEERLRRRQARATGLFSGRHSTIADAQSSLEMPCDEKVAQLNTQDAQVDKLIQQATFSAIQRGPAFDTTSSTASKVDIDDQADNNDDTSDLTGDDLHDGLPLVEIVSYDLNFLLVLQDPKRLFEEIAATMNADALV